ncbi:MAG: hypothetical protein K6D97_04150 [Clostridia bacterium]|nr:hypothetical protein [Clostridia bacterium]
MKNRINEKYPYEKDVGIIDRCDTNRNDKTEMFKETINKGISDLSVSIEKYGHTGRVPINGVKFDARLIANLKKCLIDISSGKSESIKDLEDLINLQLLCVSQYWRQLYNMLTKKYYMIKE